jgi:hypothetical protein
VKELFPLPKFLGILAVLLAALLAVGPVYATGFITVDNGDFAFDSDWQLLSGGYAHDSVVGNLAPGSARLVAGAGAAIIYQCVNVTASSNPYISIRGYVTGAGTTLIQLTAYEEPDCQGSSLGSATSNEREAGASWQEVSTSLHSPTGTALEVPTGGSVLIVLTVTGTDDGITAWFDDVEVYVSGPNAVTLHGFSAQAQASAVWLLPVALLVAVSGVWLMLRRRRA